MGRGPFGIAVVLACVSGGCAQGDLDANTSFGMTQAGSTADDDDDDDESGDDGDTTGGSDGGSSGAGSTSASADGDTSTADSADSSSGAPVTATAEESTTEPAESSEGEPATTEAGDEMSESSDGMPMEDDGPPPMADAWESCDTLACVADAPCITVTGLRDYSPYCAPECMVDADCPDPGGTAEVVCGLVPEGETEPTQCAAFCEFDGMVLGVCPAGMSCVDVPDQMTQIAVCLWP